MASPIGITFTSPRPRAELSETLKDLGHVGQAGTDMFYIEVNANQEFEFVRRMAHSSIIHKYPIYIDQEKTIALAKRNGIDIKPLPYPVRTVTMYEVDSLRET
jgi:hypothetical protein